LPLLEGDKGIKGEQRKTGGTEVSSGLDPETEAELKVLRPRFGLTRTLALIAAVAWPAALVYQLYVYGTTPAPTDVDSWRIVEAALFSLAYFAFFIALNVMIFRRTSDMYNAATKGDIFYLRKLNSTGWAFLSLVFSLIALIILPSRFLLFSFSSTLPLGITTLGLGFSLSVPSFVLFLCSSPATGALLIRSKGRIDRLRIPAAPPYVSGPLLKVEHMVKFFNIRRTFSQSLSGAAEGKVHAVDDVSFEVQRAQIYGLAGESGSGKTTVLRVALMLTPPTSGSIMFKGKDVSKMSKGELAKYRISAQVVFQDPYESTNPRMTVFEIIAEGIFVNNLVSSREEAIEKVTKALRDVQLTPPEEYLYRYPHELSGGQRQRVAIARALVLDPELIFADEPVSMLDVSIRAEVINTLLTVREKRGISVLMVTHDLALSKDVVDELGIMYVGKIVEVGPAEDVVSAPYHPYTHALTAAVPVPDPTGRKVRVLAKGEIPTNTSPPSGCRFHPRCAFAQTICAEKEPPLQEVAPGRQVACHFWKEAHDAFSKGLDAPVASVAQG
jgi:peptide/nickel transport system ATP-binding protein